MTHKVNSSDVPLAHQEVAATTEVRPETIEAVLSILDLDETPDLLEARLAVIAGLTDTETDPATMRAAWIQYAMIIEKIAELADDLPRAQIAATIHKALIFRDVSMLQRYIEELDIAEVYAANMNMVEISDVLGQEIERVIEPLEMSSVDFIIKLRWYISDANRAHLRDLVAAGDDPEVVINNTYAMILDEGGDPDEVLQELGMIE